MQADVYHVRRLAARKLERRVSVLTANLNTALRMSLPRQEPKTV